MKFVKTEKIPKEWEPLLKSARRLHIVLIEDGRPVNAKKAQITFGTNADLLERVQERAIHSREVSSTSIPGKGNLIIKFRNSGTAIVSNRGRVVIKFYTQEDLLTVLKVLEKCLPRRGQRLQFSIINYTPGYDDLEFAYRRIKEASELGHKPSEMGNSEPFASQIEHV